MRITMFAPKLAIPVRTHRHFNVHTTSFGNVMDVVKMSKQRCVRTGLT